MNDSQVNWYLSQTDSKSPTKNVNKHKKFVKSKGSLEFFRFPEFFEQKFNLTIKKGSIFVFVLNLRAKIVSNFSPAKDTSSHEN